MPKLATLTCWVLGVLFVVAGVLTVALGNPATSTTTCCIWPPAWSP